MTVTVSPHSPASTKPVRFAVCPKRRAPSALTRALALLVLLLSFTPTARAEQATASTQPSAPPAPYRPLLFAYGSSQNYWVANVEQYREGARQRYKTLVRGQTLPAGDWRDMGVVYGHAAALANLQGELAVLLDDGAWKRVGEAGITTGPTVPGSGQVLAWGSADGGLYAVRAIEGGKEAVAPRPTDTTQPATAPSTQPATRPAPPAPNVATTTTKPATTRPLTLVLLRYDRGQWVGVADLPPELTGATLSLAGVGDKPLLAASAEPGVIRTLVWDDDRWQDLGEIRPAIKVANFGAVSAGHLTAVWAVDAEGGMNLFVKREGEAWSMLKSFALPKAPAGAQRAIAAAGEEFRVVFLKDGKFWEQRYEASGSARGSVAEMPMPLPNRPDPLIRIIQTFVLLGMVLVILITFYRRRAATRGKDDEE